MNEMQVTVLGNVAGEVSYGETANGVPMANFRLGCTERRYDRQRECWVDGDTHWLTVTAWRALAVNLIGSLSKGDPVLVSGRLKVREWGEAEAKRTRVEIDARSVGHDLTRGTTAFRRATGVRGQPPGAGGRPGAEPEAEAVPEWIVRAIRSRPVQQGEASGAPGTSEVSEGERGGGGGVALTGP